jgi:hypothetical protein
MINRYNAGVLDAEPDAEIVERARLERGGRELRIDGRENWRPRSRAAPGQ